jgi:hypothetical protein
LSIGRTPDGSPQPIGVESVTIQDCQRVSQIPRAIPDVEKTR